jgi:signal transduction histidine kinase
MRRRIAEAIVGVAAFILVVLGIPLALAVHSSILDNEVVQLQATAAHTLVEIDLPLDRTEIERVSAEQDALAPFGVYDTSGNLLVGVGPNLGDEAVREAQGGVTASTTNGRIVVATPIIDHNVEKVVGVLRVEKSLARADHRSRVAWLLMIAVGLSALGLAWIIARRLARALSQPVAELASAAARLGDGGTFKPAAPSGIVEIDTLSEAFAESSRRVNESLARERRFSADVSHQLRTPLTGLRLRLEAADTLDPESTAAALDDLARIEETVDYLIAFSRDSIPTMSAIRLDQAVERAVERWAGQAQAVHRELTADSVSPVLAIGSPAAVDQILDVLIDNAVHHGRGEIAISTRHLTGGAAIDVADEGDGIAQGEETRIFDRGFGHHNGIGLALARSMAEAEGGRLLLVHRRPTVFSLILLNPDGPNDEE